MGRSDDALLSGVKILGIAVGEVGLAFVKLVLTVTGTGFAVDCAIPSPGVGITGMGLTPGLVPEEIF